MKKFVHDSDYSIKAVFFSDTANLMICGSGKDIDPCYSKEVVMNALKVVREMSLQLMKQAGLTPLNSTP